MIVYFFKISFSQINFSFEGDTSLVIRFIIDDLPELEGPIIPNISIGFIVNDMLSKIC